MPRVDEPDRSFTIARRRREILEFITCEERSVTEIVEALR
jgi:hypothetical protein